MFEENSQLCLCACPQIPINESFTGLLFEAWVFKFKNLFPNLTTESDFTSFVAWSDKIDNLVDSKIKKYSACSNCKKLSGRVEKLYYLCAFFYCYVKNQLQEYFNYLNPYDYKEFTSLSNLDRDKLIQSVCRFKVSQNFPPAIHSLFVETFKDLKVLTVASNIQQLSKSKQLSEMKDEEVWPMYTMKFHEHFIKKLELLMIK